MADFGTLPGWLGAAGIGVTIYFLKSIHIDLKNLTEKVNSFTVKVTEEYAREEELVRLREECTAEHRILSARIEDIHVGEWASRTSGD